MLGVTVVTGLGAVRKTAVMRAQGAMPTSAWAWWRAEDMPTQTWAWHPAQGPSEAPSGAKDNSPGRSAAEPWVFKA